MLRLRSDARATGVLACLGLLLIGWTGLLVPSLIREIERDFGQSDAGLGIYYFVGAAAYASGSFGGGMLTERFGRRRVLTVATALLGLGTAVLGVVPASSSISTRRLVGGPSTRSISSSASAH